jgi:sugar lactone lactonase YvrE
MALLKAGAVARYHPDGRLDKRISVPVMQLTKPCFGGPQLDVLYLTTAAHRYFPGDAELGENAGGIFAIRTGHTGIAEPKLTVA